MTYAAGAAGTESITLVTDAAAAKAIETLNRRIQGLEGQLAAMDAQNRATRPIGDAIRDRAADAAAQAHARYREQIRRDQDPTTPEGARRAAISNAWR